MSAFEFIGRVVVCCICICMFMGLIMTIVGGGGLLIIKIVEWAKSRRRP